MNKLCKSVSEKHFDPLLVVSLCSRGAGHVRIVGLQVNPRFVKAAYGVVRISEPIRQQFDLNESSRVGYT